MSVATIANRYARALADVIVEKGEATAVADELKRFAALVEGHAQLREVFASPVIAPDGEGKEGLELELSAAPVAGLSAYATVGYLDARYDEFQDRVGGVLQDVSYLDLKGAPRWSYAAGFSWTLPLPVPGALRLSSDVSHRTRMENVVANTPIVATPALTLVDASLSWTSQDDHWNATIAGKNLTDKHYIGAGLHIAGLTTVLYPADPRTWSASLRYRF